MSILHYIPLTHPHGDELTAVMQLADGNELAIILPGLRYGCERPLLAAVAQVFVDRGCDVARLTFTYAQDDAFLNASDDLQFARIASDGRDILSYLTALKSYQRIWIIGKSLGTLAMAAYLSQMQPDESLQAIWLTPVLFNTPLLHQMLAFPGHSLVILGSNDPSNHPDLLDPLRAHFPISVHIIDKVDHGFMHPDGEAASIRAVGEAATLVRNWANTWNLRIS